MNEQTAYIEIGNKDIRVTDIAAIERVNNTVTINGDGDISTFATFEGYFALKITYLQGAQVTLTFDSAAERDDTRQRIHDVMQQVAR